jgi:hypothetical protein
MLDGVRGGILGGQQRYPHVPHGVVDQQQEVALATGSRWRDRTTEIAVDEL